MNKAKLEKAITKTPVVFICAMVCCALWGSAFPFIKLGYSVLGIESGDWASQILFAGIRFFLAGVLTIILGSILSGKMLVPKKESIAKITLLSFLQTVLQYVFFYIGLAHTTGTKSSIINSVSVFFAVIISGAVFKQDKITAAKIIGCIIGFAGVVIVNLKGAGFDAGISFSGEGFIVLSALSYAFSSVYIKKFSEYENPVVLSGFQFILGGIVMALFALAFGGRLNGFNPKGAAVILYLAAVSAAAYTLWGILLKYNPVSKVAVFGFMTPVFGCLLSAWILRESPAGSADLTVISLVLVCIGIFSVNNDRLISKGDIND